MKNMNFKTSGRRNFIKKASIGTMGMMFPSLLTSCSKAQNTGKKLGIALVGLGYYSTDLLGPALQETEHSYLAGIVTGTPEKEKTWSEKYNIPRKNIYNYENFDSISENQDIDIIYIVLPNFMHKEYTIRAAQAGKHVICEKPMALNAQECREMIEACEKHNVKLAIGYRMQYEPYTQEIMRLGQDEEYGKIKLVTGGAGFVWPDTFDNWRLHKEYGGGAMMDMGVYPLNAARYITGMEPVAVSAQTFTNRPEIFHEVDEITSFQLEFPNGAVANLITSFHAGYNYIRATAEEGWFRLDPFQSYSGIAGETSEGPLEFPEINQQAAQMDEFALNVMNDEPVRVPGEEGLSDMIVVDAVFKSLEQGGKRITIQ